MVKKYRTRRRFFRLRLGGRRERLRKGGWLLMIYPLYAIVALFNLSYGGFADGWFGRAVFLSFHVGCLLYAAVYLGSLLAAIRLAKTGHRVAAFKVSAVPLAYVAVLSAIGAVYGLLQGD